MFVLSSCNIRRTVTAPYVCSSFPRTFLVFLYQIDIEGFPTAVKYIFAETFLKPLNINFV